MIEYEEINIPYKKIVIKNAIWLYFATFINKISKLILTLASARLLGPYLFGSFSYVISIINFFFIFSDWGLSNILIKNFQIYPNKDELVKEIISIKLILIVLISLLSIIGYFFIKTSEAKDIYFILFSTFILLSFRDLINVYFKAIQKMEIEAISLLFENIITAILGITLVYFYRNIIYLGIAYLIGAIISLTYILINIYKNWLKLDFILNIKKSLLYIKEGMPLFFLGFLGFIFFGLDNIMLGFIRGMNEVGYYSIVTKIILNLNLIPGIAMTALFPYLSKISTDYTKLKFIYRKILFGFIIVSILLSMFLFLTTDYWFLWLLGERYKNSILVFKLLIWSSTFLFSLVLLDNLLFILNKQWLNFYFTSICAVSNFILNLILIPHIGMFGAALATFLSQALNFILSFYLVEKTLKEKIYKLDFATSKI